MPAYNSAQQIPGGWKNFYLQSRFTLAQFPYSALCSQHIAQDQAQRNGCDHSYSHTLLCRFLLTSCSFCFPWFQIYVTQNLRKKRGIWAAIRQDLAYILKGSFGPPCWGWSVRGQRQKQRDHREAVSVIWQSHILGVFWSRADRISVERGEGTNDLKRFFRSN